MAEAGHSGISNFEMMLGKPTHDAIVGEAAYFTAPAILKFKVRGQPITQSGAMFTVALRRTHGKWAVSAWSWTKRAGGGTDDMK